MVLGEPSANGPLLAVGSILFGIAADRYGRKWPFIVNNILFIVLELVSRLVTALQQGLKGFFFFFFFFLKAGRWPTSHG